MVEIDEDFHSFPSSLLFVQIRLTPGNFEKEKKEREGKKKSRKDI